MAITSTGFSPRVEASVVLWRRRVGWGGWGGRQWGVRQWGGRQWGDGIVAQLGFNAEVDHGASVGLPYHFLGLPHLWNSYRSTLKTKINFEQKN